MSEGKLPRVLVVDDEASVRKTMRRVFRRELDMVFADGVDDALEKLEPNTLDIALVDWAMPGRPGLDLLVELQKRAPEIPCLIVTAHGDLAAVKEAWKAGLCRAIVMKPWRPESLKRWIDQIVALDLSRRSVQAMGAGTSSGDG